VHLHTAQHKGDGEAELRAYDGEVDRQMQEAGEGVIPETNGDGGGACGSRCSGGARSACSRAPAAAAGGGARPEREATSEWRRQAERRGWSDRVRL